MLYVKFTKDYFKEMQNENTFSKIISQIIYFWKNITGGFYKKRLDFGELIILTKHNKKVYKNIIKYLKLINVKTICISDNLYNTEIISCFESEDIKILDGNFLYKHLIKKIVQYICSQRKCEVSSQEISILVKGINEIDYANILLLSQMCKNINIITDNELKLRKLEEYLYSEKGIILNVTNNYEKSLLKSDIIININYEEDELNKYSFPRKGIVVNIEKSAKILYKGFDGINIFSYKIVMPKKYINEDLNIDDFNKEILYESFIYKKTNPNNLFKQIDKDNLKIEDLVGLNGNIRKKEYLRLEANKNQ